MLYIGLLFYFFGKKYWVFKTKKKDGIGVFEILNDTFILQMIFKKLQSISTIKNTNVLVQHLMDNKLTWCEFIWLTSRAWIGCFRNFCTLYTWRWHIHILIVVSCTCLEYIYTHLHRSGCINFYTFGLL